MNIKKIGKALTSPAISIVRSFLNAKYVKNNIVYDNNKKEGPIKVLFTILRIETFTSYISVYKSMVEDERFEVYVLPIPRVSDDSDGFEVDDYQKNYDYGCNLPGKHTTLRSYFPETKSYLSLDEMHFDYIFLGMPYANQYPAAYNFDYLMAKGKLCYIPYGSTFRFNKELLPVSFNDDVLKHLYFGFFDTLEITKYCRKRLRNKRNDYLLLTGLPRFDIIDLHKKLDINTVLWLPRWTPEIIDGNPGSHFLTYKDWFLKEVKNNPKQNIIIRPHPLMFPNYIHDGIMSEEEVNSFKNTINQSGNSRLDDSSSYIDALNEAGIVVADFSSLVIEAFALGKIIIYCGSKNDFKGSSKYIGDSIYFASNEDEIEKTIEMIRNGKDSKNELRQKALRKFFSLNKAGSIGESIKTIISEDYFI